MADVETPPARGTQVRGALGEGAVGHGAQTHGAAGPVVVTVVEAPACHLCEDAKSALADLARFYPITIEVVSIQDKPGRALMDHHRAPMSPLVLLDGQYFSSGRLPRRKLEKRLKRAQHGGTP